MEKAAANPSLKKKFHNLRFERKFIYVNTSPQDVINTIVLTNNFCFREIYHRRSVNNIYFDDQNYSFYKMNVSGVDFREKYRLRWYSDHFRDLKDSTFEIKKKFGLTGDKLSFKIPDLEIDLLHSKPQHIISQVIENSSSLPLNSKVALLMPTLYNSYERRYFLSDCENFRITIDYNMKFYHPKVSRFDLSQHSLPDVVLELKYPCEFDKQSRELTQAFKVRLSKNSKYVRGCDLIYNLQS